MQWYIDYFLVVWVSLNVETFLLEQIDANQIGILYTYLLNYSLLSQEVG